MDYNFEVSESFQKDFKILFKKYKSLKNDFEKLLKEIPKNPNIGVDLGGGFRKIRMAITSKNKGKSGGSRVITHEIIINTDEISMLFVAIYDKSEFENIDLNIIKKIAEEFRKK